MLLYYKSTHKRAARMLGFTITRIDNASWRLLADIPSFRMLRKECVEPTHFALMALVPTDALATADAEMLEPYEGSHS